ncbi:hypothetical protein BKA64DRAFT_642551 [Cadophora sp. MPI-SDFR-AT-0126]|nr:hypothetical protein BKA64DRAFT_642551 [Leotiomycetes sp. MPI-SDFR-AT-0126]
MPNSAQMFSQFPQISPQLPVSRDRFSRNQAMFSDDDMFAIISVMLGSEEEYLIDQALQFEIQLHRIHNLGMNDGFMVAHPVLAAQMNAVKQQPQLMGGQSQTPQLPGVPGFSDRFQDQNKRNGAVEGNSCGYLRARGYEPFWPPWAYRWREESSQQYTLQVPDRKFLRILGCVQFKDMEVFHLMAKVVAKVVDFLARMVESMGYNCLTFCFCRGRHDAYFLSDFNPYSMPYLS